MLKIFNRFRRENRVMFDNLTKGFINNIKKVVKFAGYKPLLYSLAGLFLVSLIIAYNLMPAFSNAYLTLLLSIIVLVVAFFVGFPLLYGCTINVANASRFDEKRKVDFLSVFRTYYQGNSSIINLITVFFKATLAMFLASFVITICAYPILNIYAPTLFEELMGYFQATQFEGSIFEFVSEDNIDALIKFYLVEEWLSIVPALFVFSRELRKNESVFYCLNVLITDNNINVSPRGFTRTFRRYVLPTVRKEYASLNIKINFVGYIVFGISYLTFALLTYFNLLPFEYGIIIGVVVSIVLYSPFYYIQRVFDCLFYIAYGDKIMQRLTPPFDELINAGRSKMAPLFKAKEDDDVVEEDKSRDSSEVKKGEDDNGVIDFTKDEKKGNDDEN